MIMIMIMIMISSLEDLHSIVISGLSSLLKEMGLFQSSSLEYVIIIITIIIIIVIDYSHYHPLFPEFMIRTIIEQKLYFKYFPHYVRLSP